MANYIKYITWASFDVDQPLPFANPLPGANNNILFINDSNLNLVLFTTTGADDLLFWNKAEVMVSLHNVDLIPFVVMAYPNQGLFCDYFINGKEFTDEGFNAFQTNPITTAKLILVDAHTNVILAIREVDLPAVLVVEIKARLRVMRNQETHSVEVLNKHALTLHEHLTSLEMWRLSLQHGPAHVGYSPGDV